MKRVLLIVIDALSSRHVKAAFDDDLLPNMQELVSRGELHEECVSIFPSITPAATASIITGEYPSEHGIPGAFFYDTEQDRVNYFGDDLWAVMRKGTGEFFNDFLVRLNEDLLSAPTLFEQVEKAGKRAASLNYLITKGEKKHPVDVPWLLRLFPGVPWRTDVRGPDLLCLGDLVAGKPRTNSDALAAPGGPFNRFGFQDESTASFLFELAKADAWRDLNVAYFPDNDYESHDSGPTSAVATLEKVDACLGELFEICGGVEALLGQMVVILTGDHSQSDLVADETARGIALNDLLADYPLVNAGDEWTNEDQLMVCPNMRAAQIYLRRGYQPQLEKIVDQLISDRRVDQVIWREECDDVGYQYHVRTQLGGDLTFRRDKSGRGHDLFDNRWDWDGPLSPVSAEVDSSGRLQFRDYPNAFERIAASFAKPAGGDVWVTAAIGHEFALPDVKVHNAGSHGSLHALDSSSPMILSGAPQDIQLPQHLRTIDIADLCRRILGIADRSESN